MENIDDVINRLYDQKKLEKLEKSRKPITQIEALKPIKNVFLPLSYFAQMVSMLLLAGGVVWLCNKFIDNAIAIIVIAGLMLIAAEGLVRYSIKMHHRKKYVKINVGNWLYYIAIPVIIASCIGSYYCSAPTIQVFAKAPTLLSVDSVGNYYTNEMSNSFAYWNQLKLGAASKASDIHQKNNWRGVTTRGARGLVLAHEDNVKSYTDSLVKHQQIIQNKKTLAIEKAEKHNEKTLKAHDLFCASFGHYTGLLSLLLYVALYYIIGFLEYYEDRHLKTLKVLKGKAESIDTNASSGVKVPQDTLLVKSLNEESSTIQFPLNQRQKEGDIICQKGLDARILVKKKDGTLKGYTKGGLRNYMNSVSDSRAEELKPIYEKIAAHGQ